ncbi:MAG: TGS domain-containing protein, partial [Planctomycetes bacterium]|nr:TGS domain-containing protein [Planctomycetota bacterium]
MSVTSDSKQIEITLPDGSKRSYPSGTTGLAIAESIGKKLAKAAVGIVVDGEERDLGAPIDHDASVAIVTRESPEGLDMLRHSAAHIMADAIQRLRPNAKLWKGPAVDDERYGFYYDIDFGDEPISAEDLPEIERRMHEIVKEDSPFCRREVSKQEGLQIARDLEDTYKIPI